MSRPDVASGQGGHPGANPFLPEWEYVPDGEPHVFGDRVYLYGSHDRFGAPIFCVGDYVCWSAPVDDLTAWREEGVIYRRGQDPANRLGLRLLFAPDVARGADGRYYLFYAFDFMGTIGVAVCDTPAATSTWDASTTRTVRPTAVARATALPSTRRCWWTTTAASGSTPASGRPCRRLPRAASARQATAPTCWSLRPTC